MAGFNSNHQLELKEMSKWQNNIRGIGMHPYQATVVPRTNTQLQQMTQQRVKYPWLVNPACERPHDCQSTNSSNSDSYHGVHYMNVNNRWSHQSHSDGLSSPVYHSPYPTDNPRLSPSIQSGFVKQYPIVNDIPTYTLPLGAQESSTSIDDCCESVVAPAARSPVPSETHIPGGCGGHCPGFEYVCYYVLQIIFVIGILTGISLCIAGSVLRRSNRGGDLGVLVYIGCLASMVCGLLLGVQCCVRRNNKKRCKQLRLRNAPPDCIQMDAIPNVIMDERATLAIPIQRTIQPVIFSANSQANTLPRDFYRSSQRYNQNHNSNNEINGIPWWRRQ